MANLRGAPGLWMRAGLCLALAQVAVPAGSAAAQTVPDAPRPHFDSYASATYADGHDAHIEPRRLAGYFPSKPSIPPKWTIPVENLGFAAPGALYLGERNSLASLGFLDENRLLFTFRVPALLRRQPGAAGESDEREIRAVVLSLPSGAVEAEANWLLHDRARYLWMLRDGHFLLRDRNTLVQGDRSLKLTPLLKFPGPLLSVELDPSQQLLVTNSREPIKVAGKSGANADRAGSSADDAASTGSSSNIDTADTSGAQEPDLVVRILDRNSGQVMLVTRVSDLVHVPINDEGYLNSVRGNGVDWTVEMNFFTGGSRALTQIKSACMPDLSFISEQEVLAAACADMGSDAVIGFTTGGKKLWIDLVPDRQVWPLVSVAPDGLRLARESLYVSHSLNAFAPLGDDDIKGQWLQVLDSATGNVAFESPVSPILDAGGNVALSPSGRRVALLNGGQLQVFELPAAPTIPSQ